jgi:hypothetical protein
MARSMRIRRTQKRKTIVVARLFAGLDSEARRSRPSPRSRPVRTSLGRA